jgi:hypothetical protein
LTPAFERGLDVIELCSTKKTSAWRRNSREDLLLVAHHPRPRIAA